MGSIQQNSSAAIPSLYKRHMKNPVIITAVCDAIKEGLDERKVEKADEEAAAAQSQAAENVPAPKERRTRVRKAVEKKEPVAAEAPAEAPAEEKAE